MPSHSAAATTCSSSTMATGLLFAFNGVTPDRRNLLAAIYGCLTIRNGVPIGYVQFDVLGAWAASRSTRFRPIAAARRRSRWADARRDPPCAWRDPFSVEPYQLGDGNDEGIDIGRVVVLLQARFSPSGRRRTAGDARRTRAAARQSRASLVTAHARTTRRGPCVLALRSCACARPAAARGARCRHRRSTARCDCHRRQSRDPSIDDAHLREFGLRSLLGWNVAEREAWARWSPLLAALPGFTRWSGRERRALVPVVRAKAARRELDFLRAFPRHSRLRRRFSPGDPPVNRG